MLFNSWTFLFFFLAVLVLYYSLGSYKKQNIFLLIASYVFYGAWNWRFLFLIFTSTAVDYFVAQRLNKTDATRRRQILLSISVIVNLGILGFFKYFNFFVDSAVTLISWIGFDPHPPVLQVVLPVGISFYTFQTMSYTIDIYRKQMRPVTVFVDYALYISFFPQLVAGPIERASRMLPQIQRPRTTTPLQIRSGAWLVLLGLFKKIVVADNLAVIVNSVFGNVSDATPSGTLLAVYGFAFQIYCDFSGYSDMARGVAKLLGIELRLNFDLPYISKTPKEFWTRWHISLSSWLRDYLYIPLGGNRSTTANTYRNLMLTMILGGLWHGADWHFVLWGVYHGLLLVLYKTVGALGFVRKWVGALPSKVATVTSIFFMFHLTCLGWILFRIEKMSDFVALLSNFAGEWTFTNDLLRDLFVFLFTVSPLIFLEVWLKNEDSPEQRPYWRQIGGPVAVGLLLTLIVVFASPGGGEFIYFQF